MGLLHRIVGFAIVGAFLVLAVWGAVLRVRGRDAASWRFWALLHYTENVVVAQAVVGLILLVLGRRQPVLHYFYGAVFPLVVVVVGRLASLRREERDYVPIAFAAFISFGLTLRALMTGLGIG